MSEPVKRSGQQPESYLPKDVPEIMKIAQENAARQPIAYEMHFVNGKLDRLETDRLIIRHVRPEDWRDMQELAISNNNAEYSDCDWLWPTDDESIQKICAPRGAKVPGTVEVKRLAKVVCTIGFNGMGKDGKMDIGHVMNGAYFGHDYEYEALAVLYDYCFRYYPAKAIIAMWPMGDKEKLAPLVKLGMELVSTGVGKAWRPNSEGVTREIEGCTPIITREAWGRSNPTGYIPKTMPEIMVMAAQQNRPASAEELEAFIARGGEPPRSKKIRKIRRLWHDLKCENFYLEGCFAAAMKAAGDAPRALKKPPTQDTKKFPLAFEYTFLMAVSGTLFTQTYPSLTSSAGMSSELGHSIMPHMFRQLGWSYLYIDRETIASQPGLVMRAVKASIKRKIPVMSRGIGNVQLKKRYFDCLPEWCLIGGYDKADRLLVNVYPEDAVTDQHGYLAIENALPGSDGLYILGEKQQKPDMAQLYKEAFRAIPSLISMPAYNGVSFGQQAYYDWADAMLDDANFADLSGDYYDGFLWKGYMAPWIVALTNECYIRRFFDQVIAECGLPEAKQVKEIYTRIHADLFRMQELHGGDFDADRAVISKPEVRRELAGLLRHMGDLHNELFELFEGYLPKDMPEIMRLAGQARGSVQSVQENAFPKPEIITRNFMLVGFEAAIDLKDKHWPGMDYVKAALKKNLHKLGNLAQPVRFFDVWEADPKTNYKKKKNHSKRYFFYGVEVTSLESIPEGFVTKDFPETTYALFKERDHGSPKFKWLEEAGYKFDTKYAEKYAMDIEVYDDIEHEGPEWDALIPVERP